MLFFRQNPFVKVFFLFAFGVMLATWLASSGFAVFITCGLLSFLLYAVVVFSPRLYGRFRLRWMPGVFFALVLVVLGCGWANYLQVEVLSLDGNCTFKGKVVGVDKVTTDGVRVLVEVSQLRTDSLMVDGPFIAMVSARGSNEALDGCVVEGTGRLSTLKPSFFPYQFDYGKYLQRRGCACTIYANEIQNLGLCRDWTPQNMMQATRRFFVRQFSAAIKDEKVQGVVNAYVLGDRSHLDADLRDSYVKSGGIHILAVSGMHVGILFLVVSGLFSFVRRRKSLYLLLCILSLWLYAWLTGFSPSVLRATIMFSVLVYGKESSRNSSLYNVLCLSGFLILIVFPNSLYDAGFWLSHLAVLGIGMCYQPLNNLVHFQFIGFRWVWSAISVSLAAQLFTVPLVLMLFNGFPVYFLITNVLVLPVVAVILIGALVIVALPVGSFMFRMVGGFVGDLVDYANDAVAWVATMPGAYWQFLSMKPWEVALYFLVVLLVTAFVQLKTFKLLLAAKLASALLLLSIAARLLISSGDNAFFASVQRQKALFCLQTGRNSVVLLNGAGRFKEASSLWSGAWGDGFVVNSGSLHVDSMGGNEVRFMGNGFSYRVFCSQSRFLRELNRGALSEKEVLVSVADGKEAVCFRADNGVIDRLCLLGYTACGGFPVGNLRKGVEVEKIVDGKFCLTR